MASTYTPGGIELLADGEKSNTWGQITNENWELMEEMVAGVQSISLTGLSTYTLTTADGVTSNGRHAVIKFTGTASGTITVTVSPNDYQKVYFIDNAVDQDVTLTQGSGANVTVPAGFKKIVYCDGAGAGAAVTDITEDLSLSGTIDASTFKIDGTEVTATAAEINLLDGVTLTTSEINGAATAAGTSYDNTSSGLTAIDVQDAIDEVIQKLHPVGSIYINATDSTNPGTLLGFGTWVAFGAGRVPVGFDSTDTLFDTAEETGGSKDAIVVSHDHTFSGSFSGTTGSAGSHAHTFTGPGTGLRGPGDVFTFSATQNRTTDSAGNHNHSFSGSVSGTTSTEGSDGTNANLQPYITVYMWKRTV